MTVSKNGKPRPMKSHRLCGKNDKYYSSKARDVKLLRDAFMLTVNTRQAHAIAEDMTIVAFWEQRYLPYCKETLQLTARPRKKPSTIPGYERIWRQHLKAHFANITLQEYEAQMGTQFLQSLNRDPRQSHTEAHQSLGRIYL
jgi:hypothetical protein